MGAMTERVKKDGRRFYLAQIKIVRKGVIVHRENQTFERRRAAAWLGKREAELNAPGGSGLPEACSPSCSNTIRTARSRTSGAYLGMPVSS